MSIQVRNNRQPRFVGLTRCKVPSRIIVTIHTAAVGVIVLAIPAPFLANR